MRKALVLQSGGASIHFLDYDWILNELKRSD